MVSMSGVWVTAYTINHGDSSSTTLAAFAVRIPASLRALMCMVVTQTMAMVSDR